ncbi:MAG: ATPase P [Anaeromyxobacteraceae bacterium]
MRADRPARLRVEIPGEGALALRHLLLDLNGTIARDGRLLPAVRRRLPALARLLEVRVLTADTFGTAARQLAGLPVRLERADTGRDKERIVRALGSAEVAAVGNGANDAAMLRRAALGIAVVGAEGAAAGAVASADVVVTRIEDALDLLLVPRRLVATLRR